MKTLDQGIRWQETLRRAPSALIEKQEIEIAKLVALESIANTPGLLARKIEEDEA